MPGDPAGTVAQRSGAEGRAVGYNMLSPWPLS